MSAVHSTERIKLVGVLVGTGSAVRSKEQIGQKKTGKDRGGTEPVRRVGKSRDGVPDRRVAACESWRDPDNLKE
ncbi:hypothetical protein [Hungatella effluvii]|uniref:hypothetical protein n=1 Tax=Hungatella effluvii TaxID=1096246 RepID=UPI002A81B256|nr:hypothetical protein [Hungatella effluvii]